ncbi:MAG: S9 family peptidase [Candidatus Zixiibacteriota bacterium]|nr:MAG: S9 family peptidase [candidate division Zixibacteria bacterium]
MQTKTTPLIPREVLFDNPTRFNPQISPNGNTISYVAPFNGVLNVWVQTPEKDDARPVTKDADRGIWEHFWARDGRRLLYLQDQGGNENWRLYSVDLETDEVADFTPFDDVQVRILELSKHHTDEILIEMNKDDARLHDAYHLHLDTGKLTQVAKNPGDAVGWLADADLSVRAMTKSNPDSSFDLMVRDGDRADWRKLMTWNAEDNISSEPICFSRDGKSIYLVDSRDANAGRLVRMEIASGAIDVLAEDPGYDVDERMINPDTYEIQAISFTKERKQWVVLDDSLSEDFDTLRKAHEGDLLLHGRDNKCRKWMVGYERDNSPIAFHIYDSENKESRFLFDNRPRLNDYLLAPIEPVSLTSRDGLTIHGYITYPIGGAKKNMPMVLNVHGGPWHRDFWGYSPEAQWLANRGYICLQVNFRGSAGYGKKFLNAGDKEWGGKMHDDLVDAVNWAVAQGIADPRRIAIYGGSYGGYAALVGATFTPDLFCCAVSVVGPSNLLTFINSIPPYWSTMMAMFHRRIGNPDTEKDFLESRSPLFKVDNIKIPMLIGQGANDPRVKKAESEQIVAAMKEKGIDHEYIVFPDEGHGFAKPENRLKFYAVAERFLSRHLGGRFEKDSV